MGDRFYMQQKEGRKTVTGEKKPRKLKAEWVADIQALLDTKIEGLDKCTITTLETLYSAIKGKYL